jgi:hypothetical protein
MGKPKSGEVANGDNGSFARNQDFAVLALLLCGGGDGLAHVEDIALKAYQLAPTRFKWERFDYPSLDTVRVALRADRGPDDLVLRTGGKFYSLTADGIVRAVQIGNHLLDSQHGDALAVIRGFQERPGVTVEPEVDSGIARNRPAQKYLRRVRNHEVFRAWQRDALASFQLWQLAELLECMPDASHSTWDARLKNLKRQATFWRDDEISKFADRVSAAVHGLLTSRGAQIR